MAALTEIVSRPSLEAAMEERVKSSYLDLNRRALEVGYRLAAAERVQGVF